MLKSIKTSVLTGILITTVLAVHAQKKVNEGTITYGMTYELRPDQQAMASRLPTEMKLKFSGNISSMETQQQGASVVFVTDGVQKTGLVLVSVPMLQKKFAARSTKENIEKMMGNTGVSGAFKATGEKVKIGSYNTEKYTYKDKKGASMALWITTELQLPAGITAPEFRQLKGTPIKFLRIQNGVKTLIEIKKLVQEKVGPISLKVPAGYELISLGDLQGMGG